MYPKLNFEAITRPLWKLTNDKMILRRLVQTEKDFQNADDLRRIRLNTPAAVAFEWLDRLINLSILFPDIEDYRGAITVRFTALAYSFTVPDKPDCRENLVDHITTYALQLQPIKALPVPARRRFISFLIWSVVLYIAALEKRSVVQEMASPSIFLECCEVAAKYLPHPPKEAKDG